MADELKALKYKAKMIKRQIDLYQVFFDRIQTSTLITEEACAELETRLKHVEGAFDTFNELQMQIEMTDDPAELSKNQKNGETVNDRMFSLISKSKTFLRKQASLMQSSSATPVPGAMSSSGLLANLNLPRVVSDIKLPTIKVPTFDGSYNHWLEWHDAFNSLVHTNTHLSQTQRFYYLRSALEDGDAKRIIESIAATSDNYITAWDRLKKRYENTSLIIHNHVRALFELPTVERESANLIRDLIDNATKHLRNLEILKEPVDKWDTLLLHILNTKLDRNSRKELEVKRQEATAPLQFKNLIEFLEQKCQILELLNQQKSKTSSNDTSYCKPKGNMHNTKAYTTDAPSKFRCVICHQGHRIYYCKSFLKLDVQARKAEVQKYNLCPICLRDNHKAPQCRYPNCKHCNGRHNCLLHENVNHQPDRIDKQEQQSPKSAISVLSSYANQHNQVILSMVCVYIINDFGQRRKVRALLDSGSQSSFITDQLCAEMQLKTTAINISVTGINAKSSQVLKRTNARIQSMYSNYSCSFTCLTLPTITEDLPTVTFSKDKLNIPEHLQIADPAFNIASQIDMLIGADEFWNLLCPGNLELGRGLPVMQETKLGWVIAGQWKVFNKPMSNIFANVRTLESLLQKFLNQENMSQQSRSYYTEEEESCEKHFMQHTTRDSSGRFIVRLPFNERQHMLGESKRMAEKRFYRLETRFKSNAYLKAQYSDFISEYIKLGHMTMIRDEQEDMLHSNYQSYYMPHHAVFKDSRTTTKIRVVFDCSVKTDSNISLNETLMVGSAVQSDMYSILFKFRLPTYVFCADIEKMYRQVHVHSDDRKYQRILWRSEAYKPLQTYELNTITYGTASGPFLATPWLKQLAIQCKRDHPDASRVIDEDIYMDDVLSGADTIERVKLIKNEVAAILLAAGFILRKWHSNIAEIIDGNERGSVLLPGDTEETKPLGLVWNCSDDTLHCAAINLESNQDTPSKRIILSTAAKIFDPLGILSPVVVVGKLIIQALWRQNISWDAPVPPEIADKWNAFQSNLSSLNHIQIPRHAQCPQVVKAELYGFADASERAFGACIYLRSQDRDGNYFVKLLTSKSRLAPLKQITLPRLELCAAALLVNLVNKIKALVVNADCWFWTDSSIVLSWINACPSKWHTFVANRVAEIQTNSDVRNWSHVKSQDNSADIISRGICPSQLRKCQLWWLGPDWLSVSREQWPDSSQGITANAPEMRNVINVLATTGTNEFSEIFQKFSTLTKLQRVMAYCLRFIKNLKLPGKERSLGNLSENELQEAMTWLIKAAQHEMFDKEIQQLKANKQLHRTSPLLSLSPFVDDQQILRVGG